MEEWLLDGFQVISHDNNPIQAGSTTRSIQVQGTFYGIVDSMISPGLLDDDSPERNSKFSSAHANGLLSTGVPFHSDELGVSITLDQIIRTLLMDANFIVNGKTSSQWAKFLLDQGYATKDESHGTYLEEKVGGIAGSGMRLAILRQRSGDDDNLTLAMVRPHTNISDEVYCLSGCSIAVTLRRKELDSDHKTYSVVGPAYAKHDRSTTAQEIIELV